MTSPHHGRRIACLMIGMAVSSVVHAQDSGALFDPDTAVPPTVYESTFSQPMGTQLLDAPQYPWASLYEPDGKFVPESSLREPSSMMMGDGMTGQMSGEMNHDQMSHDQMNHGDNMEMSMSDTDSRGIVKKIYHKDGKVKLKHGPINKLEMPGMTMIFYVKDEALLEDLSEGDEVGFDVEMDGSSFYIIRFER